MKHIKYMSSTIFIFMITSLLIFLLKFNIPSQLIFENFKKFKERLITEFTIIYIILILTSSYLIVRRLENGQLLFYFGNGFSREHFLIDLLISEYILIIPFLIPHWIFYHTVWTYVNVNLNIVRVIITDLLMIVYFILFLLLISYFIKSFVLYLSINLALIVYQSFNINVPNFLLPLFPMLFHERLLVDFLIGKNIAVVLGAASVLSMGVVVWRLRYLLR